MGSIMPLENFAYSENLLNLAAVIYRPEDDIDRLLASFAERLRGEDRRIGGIVQRNRRGDCGPVKLMEVIDLMTEQVIPICQNLGTGSVSCRLDVAGLAEAAQAVRSAIAQQVELVVVNKFGKTEADGRGLRAEIAQAIIAGLPVLTAVPDRFYGAWHAFTGGFGTTLLCDSDVVEDWWREMSRRTGYRRARSTAGAAFATV
jgi:nucleoside-triphosphatase THEP1